MIGSSTRFILLSYCLHHVYASIKGELCTDISTYTPLVWHDGQECCKVPVGTPVCTTTTEQACIDVEETVCHTEIKDEFEMTDCPLNTKMVMRTPHNFTPYTHNTVGHQFTHIKHNFTCENKTRQNCETIWVTNESGEKVSIPGTCEEVTWLDCFKTPYEATFDTIKHKAVPLPPIPYETCFEEILPNVQKCIKVKEVLVSVCKKAATPKCMLVTTKSCKPTEGKRECISSGRVPWQERIHKEKCLKPDPDSGHHSEEDHHGNDHHDGHHLNHQTGHGHQSQKLGRKQIGRLEPSKFSDSKVLLTFLARGGRAEEEDKTFKEDRIEESEDTHLEKENDGKIEHYKIDSLLDRYFKLKTGELRSALG